MFSHQQRLGKWRLMAGAATPIVSLRVAEIYLPPPTINYYFFKKNIVDAHFLKKLNVLPSTTGRQCLVARGGRPASRTWPAATKVFFKKNIF